MLKVIVSPSTPLSATAVGAWAFPVYSSSVSPHSTVTSFLVIVYRMAERFPFWFPFLVKK